MTDERATAPETTRPGLSRRKVVQTAAWGVPAIVLATAVPASATASGTLTPSSVKVVKTSNGILNLVGPTFQFTITWGGSSPGDHGINRTLTLSGITLLGTYNPSSPGTVNLTSPTTVFTYVPLLTVNLAGTAKLEIGTSEHGVFTFAGNLPTALNGTPVTWASA